MYIVTNERSKFSFGWSCNHCSLCTQ